MKIKRLEYGYVVRHTRHTDKYIVKGVAREVRGTVQIAEAFYSKGSGNHALMKLTISDVEYSFIGSGVPTIWVGMEVILHFIDSDTYPIALQIVKDNKALMRVRLTSNWRSDTSASKWID